MPTIDRIDAFADDLTAIRRDDPAYLERSRLGNDG